MNSVTTFPSFRQVVQRFFARPTHLPRPARRPVRKILPIKSPPPTLCPVVCDALMTDLGADDVDPASWLHLK